MITFDPKSQAIQNTSNTKKSSKDKGVNKFSAKSKVGASSASHNAKELANISPMLFLQEVGEYNNDQDTLEEFAKKAFKSLKGLELALINNNIDEQNLLSLKKVLENKYNFVTHELQNLAEEIETRVAVEIAKLERVKN